MIPRTIATLMLIVVPLTAEATDVTAKTGLAQATVQAQKWQKGAVLVRVQTLQAKPDGTAGGWEYLFCSPPTPNQEVWTLQAKPDETTEIPDYMFFSPKASYSVQVKNGQIVKTIEVTPRSTCPVGEEYVDSDKAMTEARKNGLAGAGEAHMLLRVMIGELTKSLGIYWRVSVGNEPGDVYVVIDGKTGKFSYKGVTPCAM